MFNIIQYLEKDVKSIVENDVAVLLSGGIDSVSCALLAQKYNKTPICYTFRIEDRDTKDSYRAKQIADIFGWELNVVDVPVTNITSDFKKLVVQYNCVKKTQVECAFPFLYVYPHIKEKNILCGLGADSHFGLSRKAALEYVRKNRFHEYSKDAFSVKNPAGRLQHLQLCKEYGKNFVTPYFNEDLRKYLATFSWAELNKPKQKMPIRETFKEDIDKIISVTKKDFEHKNLQLVAEIPSYFEKYVLTDRSLNVHNRKNILHLIKDYKKSLDTYAIF